MKSFFGLSFILLLIFVGSAVSADAQLFYKIARPGSDAVDYIYGSHHMAPLSIFENNSKALEAFRQSDVVVGEIDMTDMASVAAVLQRHSMAPADSTLSQLVKGDDYARLREVFAAYSPMPGLTVELVDAFKPMVVSSMIAMGVMKEDMPGFNEGDQLDSYLLQSGRSLGKRIQGLETVEEQAGLLYDGMSLARQALELVEMISDVDKLKEETAELNNLYIQGDLESLYLKTLEEETNPEFRRKLIDRRNATWLEKLPAILDSGNCFVVVGALHLPGEEGVLQGLRDKGYLVEAVDVEMNN